MRGHIWTAFLNPFDHTPISSTFFLTTLLSPFFHPKPLLYLSHSPLILILMLLLISGDIHPNPGSIDPCSACSRRVTWGNRSVQCTNCSLWYTSSALVFLLLAFVKFSRDTLGLAQCAHLPLNPVPSPINTPNPPSSLTNNHKTISSKMIPHPKTTTNNPTNLPNHPQLIFNYPLSASTIPPPQTQYTISPLTQSSFYPSSPYRNNLRILQWNANGIRPPVILNSHTLFRNQYDLIFVQESHL